MFDAQEFSSVANILPGDVCKYVDLISRLKNLLEIPSFLTVELSRTSTILGSGSCWARPTLEMMYHQNYLENGSTKVMRAKRVCSKYFELAMCSRLLAWKWEMMKE